MALLRLAAWQAILAAALAAFLLGVAVVDATGPRSCGEADASREAGLLADAEKDYGAILDEEPDSACAQDGMTDLATAHCELADQAEQDGDKATAKSERAAALKIEPKQTLQTQPPDKDCALTAANEEAPATGESGAAGGG